MIEGFCVHESEDDGAGTHQPQQGLRALATPKSGPRLPSDKCLQQQTASERRKLWSNATCISGTNKVGMLEDEGQGGRDDTGMERMGSEFEAGYL